MSHRSRPARHRLKCELLETREVPAVATVTQSFDTSPLGSLPGGWTSWSNDWPGTITIANQIALSPNQALTSTGGSAFEARAWSTTSLTADATASAAVFTESLIPATVFVRGNHLASDTPTYYGATVTRGLTVQLVRVSAGETTVLGTIPSKQYFSQKWVALSITAEGTQISANVIRQDTGQWLNAAGQWVANESSAISVTDSAISGPGSAGLARPSKFAGRLVFDDFQAVSLTQVATPPVVVATASQSLDAVQGSVRIAATAETTSRITRVEFKFDGRTLHAKSSAPADWTLDSTKFANGPHELVIRAIDEFGNVGTITLPITIANPEIPPTPVEPVIPRHFEHIRIAQLAYSGTPMSSFEQQKLANAVDLVIPNAEYFAQIDQITPKTPQLLYTNLSNLYLDHLPSWMNYADSQGISREAAFYHVAKATPWTHASGSAYPVSRFWEVYLASPGAANVDYTSAAYGGRLWGPAMPAAGQSTVLSYLDKFREINFDLTRGAQAGWQYVFEYPAAVASNGTVTQWKTLTIFFDSTSGLTRSGRLTFNPPSDWVPAANAPGGARFYSVRLRAITGTAAQAPQAKTILGRDYDNSGGKLTGGVIPAFDSLADKDGDGYLNDVEFAARRAGFEARFLYESRMHFPNYGPNRLATNPASPAVRAWAAKYQAEFLAANPLADGLFVDNSNGRLTLGGATVVESTTGYTANYAAMVAAVRTAIPGKFIFANTVGGLADAVPVAAQSSGVVEEFLLRPMQANWSTVLDVAKIVQDRLNAASPAPYTVLDTHPGGGGSITDARTKLGALAYYYLFADPDRTMIMFFGGEDPNAAWSQSWIAAAEVDVGRPTAAMSVWATGKDPQNGLLDYRVYGREYENALVLYKPRSYTHGKGTGTTDTATATQHKLTGTYRTVNADGTLGAVVTNPTITLRNGEGAILLKV